MSHGRSVAGVPVEVGVVPARPPAGWGPHRSGVGGRLTAGDGWALLDAEGVGRFLVRGGDRITLDVVAGARDDLIDLWLHDLVVVLLAGQRGRFVLHASTVELAGRHVAVVGTPGAGTSTTAMALWRGGGQVLTDVVSLVVPPPAGSVSPALVVPTGRAAHAAGDTLRRLGLDGAAVGPATTGGSTPQTDRIVPLPPTGPRPLHGLVVLRATGNEVRATAVADLAARARLLHGCVLQRELAEWLWPAPLQEWVTAVAAAQPVWVLDRPAEGWTVDQVAAEVRRLITSAPAGSAAIPG